MVKLSVIIPVYNVEAYLCQCVESILNQEMEFAVEVILINDGSTDNSGAICDEYALSDPRVRTIHTKNEGLSAARNKGIFESTGEYIAFLDSDDYWLDGALCNFIAVQRETNADIIIGGAIRYRQSIGEYCEYPNNITGGLQKMTKTEVLTHLLERGQNFQWHVWKSFYRAEIIKENKAYFKEGFLFEDVEWTPQIFYFAKSFASFSEPFICYRVQRERSITTDPSQRVKRLRDMLKATEYLTRHFENVEIEKNLKEAFFSNFSVTYYHVFLRQTLISDPEYIELLKKQFFLLRYDKRIKARAMQTLTKILGYRIVCLIIQVVGKLAFWIKY